MTIVGENWVDSSREKNWTALYDMDWTKRRQTSNVQSADYRMMLMDRQTTLGLEECAQQKQHYLETGSQPVGMEEDDD